MQTAKPHVAVVGAGAFGGWSALGLLRKGARVTLLDAWGPGNSRASSGGETRIIRAHYGSTRVYAEMAARSLHLWRQNEERWKSRLFRRIGVLWLVGRGDAEDRAAARLLAELELPFEEFDAAEAALRYPQVSFRGVQRVLLEKDAGYLMARRACQTVLEGFLAEGGEYRQLAAQPGPIESGRMGPLLLSDGSRLAADHYVFAAGPWLGKLFAQVVGSRIQPTRQEIFFFGTGPGDPRFGEDSLPAWIDNTGRRFYGIPGNEWRGFKVADDTRGEPFDPTLGERVASSAGLRAAREYLAHRFPGLKGAPLLESRVCQYENTPDLNLILDRHPEASDVWIVGGGSGHGFKLGPAVGERVAALVLDGAAVDPFFGLARLRR